MTDTKLPSPSGTLGAEDHKLAFPLDTQAKGNDRKKPPGLVAFEKARATQQEMPRFQKLVERDAKRGTNRNVYLLMDRVFSVTSPAPKGLVGPRIRDPEENKSWIMTPNGLIPRERWHELEQERRVARRAAKRRRRNKAARAMRRQQRCHG